MKGVFLNESNDHFNSQMLLLEFSQYARVTCLVQIKCVFLGIGLSDIFINVFTETMI